MELQKAQNNQNNFEKSKSWMTYTPQFQNLLQSYRK